MDSYDYFPNTHKYNTRYKKKMKHSTESIIEPLNFQLFLTKMFPSNYMKKKSQHLMTLNNSKLKKKIIKKNKHYSKYNTISNISNISNKNNQYC